MELYETEIVRIVRALLAREIDAALGCRLVVEQFGPSTLPDDDDVTIIRAAEEPDSAVPEERLFEACFRLLMRLGGGEPAPA